jgi:2-amino-4-hydroxy-6-hydroxymethyldihydropteridine diphosphokinase
MDPASTTAQSLVSVCVGLGSNLGDRVGHLAAGVAKLRSTADFVHVVVSGIYETDPVGPKPQGPYLNAAACFETSLAARAVLDRLLEIEACRGRRRTGVRNSARTLDLDLLLYGDEHIAAPGLVVPHPELCRRAFVLEPLAEIAGARVLLDAGETVAEIAARLRDPTAVRRVASNLDELAQINLS